MDDQHVHRPITTPTTPALPVSPGLVAALSMTFGRKGDARLVVRPSGMESDDVVVDVGCGPGVVARYVAQLGATVTGVDPTPVMLRIAKLLTRRPAKVRYTEGVAEAIRLPDDSASVVWSIATVHHWSDIDAGLREIRRLLLPGGRFVAIGRRAQTGSQGHASHGWTDAEATAFADRCRYLDFADVRLERTTMGRRSTISVIAGSP